MIDRESRRGADGGGVRPDRREFGRMALTGTYGAAVFLGATGRKQASARPIPPGIKLCAQSSAKPSNEQLLLLRQIGAAYVSVGSTPDLRTTAGFRQIVTRYADAGITVWNIGNTDVHNMPEVTLNLPGRDARIAQYKQYLRSLSEAGVYYTTYAHMGNGIWSSGRALVRGAPSREFDLASPNKKGFWVDKTWREPLSHGRVFTKKEIWENYTYFIRQVAPVAEEVGVRIGIHPDDPPVPVLAGVPRCIFSSFEGYKRALEIANSPNVGMGLCVGCWLEGGPRMGRNVVETIEYFGGLKKLFVVHFRNVHAPLPHFRETYLNEGYMDMYKVMKALRKVNFEGVLIGDHFPRMVTGDLMARAYTIGYIQALIERANEEAFG